MSEKRTWRQDVEASPLPCREVSSISRDEIVGPGSQAHFDEHSIRWVRQMQVEGFREARDSSCFDEIQELVDECRLKAELASGQDIAVFGQYAFIKAQRNAFREDSSKDCCGWAIGGEDARHQYVGV
jgi:hypothetical protein